MDYAIHPRPQLARPTWIDLTGEWAFAFDDDARWERPEDVEFDRVINVPFPPESKASGLRDTSFHPVVWYRRTFSVGAREPRSRSILHFGAVDYRATIWVNGHLVAQHEGGHTPFCADVTAVLTGGAEQLVVVRAEDDPLDLAQPRGKQGWEARPHTILYHRTTGIWQPVWLETVGEVHVQTLRWTPDLDRTELILHARLNVRPATGMVLKVRLSLKGEALAEQTVMVFGREMHMTFSLARHDRGEEREKLLWSPRTPNLIDAHLELTMDGEVLDAVTSYAGLRSVEVRDGHFALNGFPYYLRLVLAQNYWPESHLAAPSAEHLRHEVALVKELGFNGVRVHQKIEDPRFLYWCDQLGLLVWGEMPSAYTYTTEFAERLTKEWLEAVRRDYSHPCVVTWVPLNESWGVPNLERDAAQRAFVRGLYQLTKALDVTRPVVANDGWQHVVGDILGVHDYTVDSAVLLERYATHEALARTFSRVQPHFRSLLLDGHVHEGAAVMLTEFGGLSVRPSEDEVWWGYGTAANAGEMLAQYEELVAAALSCEGLVGFCYTQLTDTEQEKNGLLTEDRRFKLDPSRVRSANTRASRAYPGEVMQTIHQDADERHQTLKKVEGLI